MLHDAPTREGEVTQVVHEYDATKMLKTPFKVVLVDAVKHVLGDDGQIVDVVIPDPEGLVKAVAQSRVLHPHKLTGPDLRFLRSALGKKAKDLARQIALKPETLSRVEGGAQALSPQSEMLVRIYVFVSTLPFTSKKKDDAGQIGKVVGRLFDQLTIRAAHAIDDEIVLKLVLGQQRPLAKPQNPANDDGVWDQPDTETRFCSGM